MGIDKVRQVKIDRLRRSIENGRRVIERAEKYKKPLEESVARQIDTMRFRVGVWERELENLI